MDGSRERLSGRWVVPAMLATLLLECYRCARSEMLAAEVKWLSQQVLTDPLTMLEVEDEHHRTLAGALALAVDAKDASTRSHSQTVSILCAVIETELGFKPEEVSRIRLAGLLHDVGKIGIPDAILKKPAKLNVEEYDKMKTHSVLGHDIVQAADMPIEADWVLHHHEHIDGGGYPDGLAGADIPLESRIIHVADAFEAMTSDRPYRVAPGEQFAVGELRRNVDTQFDSGVVAALLRVLDDRPEGVSIILPQPSPRPSPPAAPRYVDVHALTSSGGEPRDRYPPGG